MSERVWTPLELLSWTTEFFREHGVEKARLDAELLLAHVLGVERIDLYVQFERPVAPALRARFRELVRSRATERVPVAYLTGVREFWSLPIQVTQDVLIPRPETELLVRTAAAHRPRRVAEIGVGSAAVVCALAYELPEAEFVAVDCSEAALEVARKNLEQQGLASRVELRCGDGATVLEPGFDVVVCNPPYVPSGELAGLAPELAHEPRIALDGGPDGLDFIRRLVVSAPELVGCGWLLLEIGHDQAERVTGLLNDAGAKEVTAHRDLAGIERVLQARFASASDGGAG